MLERFFHSFLRRREADSTPLKPLLVHDLKEFKKKLGDLLSPWKMLPAMWKIDIKDYRGKRIHYEGVRFEGTPQIVFRQYFDPFVTNGLIEIINKYCVIYLRHGIAESKAKAELMGEFELLVARFYQELARAEYSLLNAGRHRPYNGDDRIPGEDFTVKRQLVLDDLKEQLDARFYENKRIKATTFQAKKIIATVVLMVILTANCWFVFNNSHVKEFTTRSFSNQSLSVDFFLPRWHFFFDQSIITPRFSFKLSNIGQLIDEGEVSVEIVEYDDPSSFPNVTAHFKDVKHFQFKNLNSGEARYFNVLIDQKFLKPVNYMLRVLVKSFDSTTSTDTKAYVSKSLLIHDFRPSYVLKISDWKNTLPILMSLLGLIFAVIMWSVKVLFSRTRPVEMLFPNVSDSKE